MGGLGGGNQGGSGFGSLGGLGGSPFGGQPAADAPQPGAETPPELESEAAPAGGMGLGFGGPPPGLGGN